MKQKNSSSKHDDSHLLLLTDSPVLAERKYYVETDDVSWILGLFVLHDHAEILIGTLIQCAHINVY